MAEPDGQGGIRQAIRLFLDKTNLNKVASDAKEAGRQAAQGLADAFRLVKIPPIEPLDPKDQRKVLKQFKKDTAEYTAEVKRLQMTQQMNNTTMTTTGRVLNALGVNVYKSSFAFQTLQRNIQNIGSGMSPAVAGIRALLNSMTGQGLSILRTFAGQLGIAFSVYRMVTFAKSAVSAAADSQAAWARLSSTLSDFGIPLSKVQGDIEALVVSQGKLGIKQQDTVEVMATLMQLTGDYGKSLKATVVVTDLMIARHMTMEQAARAVGRAIDGDTMLLSRQGIYLDKNRDAIEQLTERMRGELAARAVTLAGKIAIISSAFNDLKIAIGEALASGGGGNWAADFTIQLQEITKWVRANQQDFAIWTEVLRGVAFVIEWIGRGFTTSLKLIESFFGLASVGFVSLYRGAKVAATGWQVLWLSSIDIIWAAWDRLFHRQHVGLSGWVAAAKQAYADAKKGFAETDADARAGLQTIWAPGPTPGAKAPDYALGTAGKIQAKAQQRLHTDIRQLGNIAMHGREDDAAAAMDALNKKLQEQEQIAAELSDTEEKRAKNVGAIRDAESNIADIKKIQTAYEKKQNDNSAQRRKDAHDMQEIERLGRVARQAKDPEDQAKAMEGLTRIQARLTAEQAKQQKYGERYFVLQNMIDQVEQQRNERAGAQDKQFKDRIDKLHDQLLLRVDEEKATADLEATMADLNKQYAAAITNEDRLRIAGRRRMVEQALQTDTGTRGARITQLETDMQDPGKRKAAEQGLLSLDKQITNEIFRRKTLQIDITDLLEQQKRIRADLADIEHTSAGDLSKELQDARRLAKTWQGRQAAAELYQKVIDDINKQLDGHIALTDEERAHLKVLLGTATQGLTRLRLITGDMVDEFKQLWEEVGQSFIDNVSTKIADSWARAAELMLGDLKDIKKGATTAFQGMGKAFAAEIKSIATLRVKQHIAEAVSEGAEAIKALAAHNYHAAAMHAKGVGHQLLAAAKWAALAGAAGNIGGQGVSGAAGGGSSGNTGANADNQQQQGPIIYLKIDGMDPTNPKHQELAGMAVEKWQETAHGAQIKLG